MSSFLTGVRRAIALAGIRRRVASASAGTDSGYFFGTGLVRFWG